MSQKIFGYDSDKINTKEGKDNTGSKRLSDGQETMVSGQESPVGLLVYENVSSGHCASDDAYCVFLFFVFHHENCVLFNLL